MQLVPVDHDPFAAAAAGGPKLVPVDHDPFASGAPDRGAVDAGVSGIARGALMGFAPEVAGAVGGALDWAGLGPEGSKGTFSGGYHRTKENALAMDAAADVQHPIASTAGQIAGGIGTMVAGAPEALTAKGATLAARAAAGAKVGGVFGAVSGAGQAGGGIDDRIRGAAEGGVTGALTGAALPFAGAAIKGVAKPFVDAVAARVNPESYAAQKVAQRITDSGMSVDQIANKIDRAAQNGDSMSVLDVGGEPVQNLARSVVNTGGPGAKTLVRQANIGAMRQGGRLMSDVTEGLGTPGMPYEEAKASVMNARSSAAKPLYDLAYKTPVPYTFDLQDILQTPAGKGALAAAKRNSLNRREPWAQWFASIGDDGTILDAKRVPDTRALDETKRVLDRMVEGAKRPADGSPFGKALNTPESLAIQSVRDDLRNFLVANNKPYAQAVQKGLDNIQADEALEFGRNVFRTDPRVIARRMGKGGAGRDPVFNEGQQQLARIGAEDAIRQKLGDASFTQNGLLRFFSDRNDIARIRPLFKGDQDWTKFRTSMFNEARKRQGYMALKGNSTTAKQLLDAQEAGQLGEAMQTGIHAVHSPIGAATSVIARSVRRLGGMTPQVGAQIAKIVSTRDPAQVQDIVRRIANIEASKATTAEKWNAARNMLTAAAAAQEGRLLGSQQRGQ